jgi:hypothetical protein
MCGSSGAYQQPHRFAVQAALLQLGEKRFECGRLVAKQGDPLFWIFLVQRNTFASEPGAVVKTCLPRCQIRLPQQAACLWRESRVEKPFCPACCRTALHR